MILSFNFFAGPITQDCMFCVICAHNTNSPWLFNSYFRSRTEICMLFMLLTLWVCNSTQEEERKTEKLLLRCSNVAKIKPSSYLSFILCSLSTCFKNISSCMFWATGFRKSTSLRNKVTIQFTNSFKLRSITSFYMQICKSQLPLRLSSIM